MFRRILVPVDNSPYSEWCIGLSLALARAFGGEIVGCHVYAARLHDDRFRQMESGLPERYHEGNELARQRRVHDSLIGRGLQLISDSYLEGFARRCAEAGVPFEPRIREGKNYAEIVREIGEGDYDLVILGARGLGETHLEFGFGNSDFALGSVCERVARRAGTNVLVVKNEIPPGGKIVAAVDGSEPAFRAVWAALALGQAFEAEVEVVAAFDPHFHTVAFRSLEGVLSDEAGKVFRFKEQQRLHDELIDDGLARIYREHLQAAERLAEASGWPITTALLTGKPYPAILKHLGTAPPSLLIVGRVGAHCADGLDIGSTAENLLRFAPCHVLLVARKFDRATGEQAL